MKYLNCTKIPKYYTFHTMAKAGQPVAPETGTADWQAFAIGRTTLLFWYFGTVQCFFDIFWYFLVFHKFSIDFHGNHHKCFKCLCFLILFAEGHKQGIVSCWFSLVSVLTILKQH